MSSILTTIFRHFLEESLTFADSPKDHVHVIETWTRCCCDVELGIVGVGFSEIGHCQHIGLFMKVVEVLIIEKLAIYRFPTGSISIGYISTLNHEPRNYPVDFSTLIM